MEILDPTHETEARAFAPAQRLTTLQGATIAIVSNGKKGTKPFFDAFERNLVEHHGVAEVVRLIKSNYSAPAEPDIFDGAQRWQAVVAGVGD